MEKGRGLAVWYKNKGLGESVEHPSAKLHFNFWRIPRPNIFERVGSKLPWTKNYPKLDFLDIGIWIKNPNSVKELSIYIPYEINADHVEDLGALFRNPDIAIGVFNEKLNPCIDNEFVDLNYSNTATHTPYTRVYQFAETGDAEIQVNRKGKGAIVHICDTAFDRATKDIEDDRSIYFRLRITLPCRSPFLKERRQVDRWFQSGFDVTEYVDFRINQKRSVPADVERMMCDKDHYPLPVDRVDFLLITEVTDEIIGNDNILKKSRILENELWSGYLDYPKIVQKGMVIYHDKKKVENEGEEDSHGTLEEYNVFIKMRVRRTGMKTMAAFAAFAVVLGVIVELFANTVLIPSWNKFFSSEQIVKDSCMKSKENDEKTMHDSKNDS